MEQQPTPAGELDEHPVLAGVLLAAEGLDKACRSETWQLGDDQIETTLGVVYAVESRTAAVRAALLGEAETRGLRQRTQALSEQAWLRDRFRLSTAAAGAQLAAAAGLARQPVIASALAEAAFTVEQSAVAVRVMDQVDALTGASEGDRQAAGEFLVEHGARLHPRELARAGQHLIETLTSAPSVDDPADAAAVQREHGAAEAAAQFAERNRMWFTRRPGGGSRTRLDLGPLGTAALRAWLGARADPPHPGSDGFGDQRPLPERRGDAMVELLGRVLRADAGMASEHPDVTDETDEPGLAPIGFDGPSMTRPGWEDPDLADRAEEADAEPAAPAGVQSRPSGSSRKKQKKSWVQVAVTIGLADLQAGLAGAGMLDTGGTLSAAEARRLACDAGIVPVVLAGPDQPLNVGRATPTWNLAQRRYLITRDRGCVAPGCDRPPADCQVHHMWEWADGGPTDIDNGALLCLYHHQQVHRQGWKAALAPNGYPQFTPPASVDPQRRTRQHHRFQLTLLTGPLRT